MNKNDWKEELKLEVPILYDIPIPKDVMLESINYKSVKKELSDFIEETKKKMIKQYELPEKVVSEYFDFGYIFSFSLNKDNKLFLHYDFSTYLSALSLYFEGDESYSVNYVEKIASGEWNKDDILTFTNDKLKSIRKEIKELKASNLQHLVSQLLVKYPLFMKDMLDKYYAPLRTQFDVPDNKKIEIMKDNVSTEITKLIMNNRYLNNELFSKEINFQNGIISTDSLKFYYNYYLLEKIIKKDDDKRNNAIYAVINYYQKTSTKEQLPKFSDYSFSDFSKSLQEYLLKHKEVNMERIDDGFFDGWSAEEVNEYLDEFEKETLKKFEVIDPNSVFFPPNKSENKNILINNDIYDKNQSKEESLLSLKKRQFYADHNDEIYQCLMGKDEFKGHIAMVLKNGYVIFEKYDVKDENFSTKNGAAYIMTINNFNKFSKKSLTEVREYIKNQDDGIINMDKITFRCHRGNWEEYISEYFNKDTGIDLNTIQNAVQSASENKHSRR